MRWADMDVYGHMNNAVHYQLFDTVVGRFELREGLLGLGRGLLEDVRPVRPKGKTLTLEEYKVRQGVE